MLDLSSPFAHCFSCRLPSFSHPPSPRRNDVGLEVRVPARRSLQLAATQLYPSTRRAYASVHQGFSQRYGIFEGRQTDTYQPLLLSHASPTREKQKSQRPVLPWANYKTHSPGGMRVSRTKVRNCQPRPRLAAPCKKKKSPSYYPWMENEPIKVCACVRENFSKWQCGVKTRGTIPCPLSNGSA